METTEEKKLPKHLQAAVDHLEKHVTEYTSKIQKLYNKRDAVDLEINQLIGSRDYFVDQLKKLKGQD